MKKLYEDPFCTKNEVNSQGTHNFCPKTTKPRLQLCGKRLCIINYSYHLLVRAVRFPTSKTAWDMQGTLINNKFD